MKYRDKKLVESSIDFPRQELDSQVWQKAGDDYVLRQNVKRHILSVIGRYPAENLQRLAAKIQIVGSICTTQFADDADIDVHIQPRDITGYDEEIPMQVKKWFDQNRDAINGWIGEHPIEVYLQLDPAQDLMSDGVYDLLADKWVVGPKEQAQDYDPYEDFSDIADQIRAEVRDADALFGELKRDVIDHEVIQQAIERMPASQRQQLVAKLETKLQEIETGIEALYKERGEWSVSRRTASKPATPEQARQDVELARKWKDQNAIFKFINRYQYMQVIGDLKTLVGDDDKLEDEDVSKIKSITGVR